MRNNIILVICSLLLVSCGAFLGEEVGRMPFTLLSNDSTNIQQISLDLKKDEIITFWAEMDLAYEGELELLYTVEVWQDTVKIGGFQIDALNTNPTLMEVKTSFNDQTSWSYKGKMDFLKIKEEDHYTFKAILQSNDGAIVTLNKADLVLRK